MATPPLPQPGSRELEVLTILWDHGPASVRQVLEQLQLLGRDIAYTTVLTILQRLESKNLVSSDRAAQAYIYKAAVSRERVTQSRLKAVLDAFYDGAAGPLVLQLIRDERFTPDEIAELRRLIDDLDRAGGGG